ncbi:MAG: rRNA maturation RNase YbeY [Hyphomonadaceae bacterium]
MAIEIDLRIEDEKWQQLGDINAICNRAVKAAASLTKQDIAKLDLLLAGDDVLAELNQQWRGKTGPTDVLSFPADPNPEGFLGDIAIAYDIAARDADKSGVAIDTHLSHLLVHGFLHLLGHDHVGDDEAERMEAIECEILASLGIANPYSRIA